MCWTLSNYLQLGMLVATFSVFFVALFGETVWDWIKRPKIILKFDKASDRCFRQATVPVDEIQNERDSPFKNVERAYYRLKVKNEGGLAKNVKVKIDIFDSEENEIPYFEPSLLNWISWHEKEDLTKDEENYVNICSQVISPCQETLKKVYGQKEVTISRRLRIELFDKNPRGIIWDLPLDNYIFKIIVHGDNIKPDPKNFAFKKPSSDIQLGDLVEI
jgi:hypothetical protein